MSEFPYDAACRDVDPELMFPLQVADAPFAPLSATESAAPARAVCRGCPVASACLEWALETGQPYGVWGGATADERAQIRRVLRGRVPTGEEVMSRR